jgi:uncharacterized RDD family membrane protein YckC
MLGIGFLMILWTAKRQGFHDQLAGCLVVTKDFQVINDNVYNIDFLKERLPESLQSSISER